MRNSEVSRAATCSTPLYVPLSAPNKITPTHVLSPCTIPIYYPMYYPMYYGVRSGTTTGTIVAEARTVLCSPKVLSSRLPAQQAAFISRRVSSRFSPTIYADRAANLPRRVLAFVITRHAPCRNLRQAREIYHHILNSRFLYCPAWLLSFATRLEPHTPHWQQSFRLTPRNAAVGQRQQKGRDDDKV